MLRGTSKLSLASSARAIAFGRSPTSLSKAMPSFSAPMQVRHLNLQEYNSKALLDKFGVTTQKWRLATTPEEAETAAKELAEGGNRELVVKAQILAGGRGKGVFDHGFKGGVHLCKTPKEARELAKNMLGHRLVTKQTPPEGTPVNKLMIAQSIDLKKELYFSILMDRAYNGPVIVASPEGGMDIETVAEQTPDRIFKMPIDINKGILPEQSKKLAQQLGFTTEAKIKDAQTQMERLYELFLQCDATQVEINPFAETPQGEIYCVDAKINFDDNAAYRQKEVFAMGDTSEDDPREVEAAKYNLNYIGMDGNIGCMVNGAGLAMATMDIIKLHKGEPANFLDVGGGATEQQVTQAFKIITSDKQVKAILVNIFGGIMKCDIIAQGIVNAAKEIGLKIPLVVRLEGTNVNIGKEILQKSGLPIITANDLDDAAKKAVAAIQKL
ncbi:Succinate--CoA ligase [GDP-forming] subunit beta, mitochondrial [Balamuthia mandrillaris]